MSATIQAIILNHFAIRKLWEEVLIIPPRNDNVDDIYLRFSAYLLQLNVNDIQY